MYLRPGNARAEWADNSTTNDSAYGGSTRRAFQQTADQNPIDVPRCTIGIPRKRPRIVEVDGTTAIP